MTTTATSVKATTMKATTVNTTTEAAWLPVVWMQIRMRRMAQDSAASGAALPEQSWKYLRAWVALGVVAFVALVIVFYLMVLKPA